tara:strand:- start:341 stop:1117 length:777 start_codon:yes stop_codon:yes gene_type:complete
MNKGTKEGTEQEIAFTKILNQKNNLELWRRLEVDHQGHYAIRVKYQKFGAINNKKVLPKADVFIAKGSVALDYLKLKGYFLDEDDLEEFSLNPVSGSGISIKRADSKKYQIIKMSPSTFKKLFMKNMLAAGASIYCNNEKECSKNKEILEAWCVSINEFELYFKEKMYIEHNWFLLNIDTSILKKIKRWSNNEIARIINHDSNISDFIFYGIGNFTEPYTATWLFVHNVLEKNHIIPFNITTGSGRSRGVYTIVLKPK